MKILRSSATTAPLTPHKKHIPIQRHYNNTTEPPALLHHLLLLLLRASSSTYVHDNDDGTIEEPADQTRPGFEFRLSGAAAAGDHKTILSATL